MISSPGNVFLGFVLYLLRLSCIVDLCRIWPRFVWPVFLIASSGSSRLWAKFIKASAKLPIESNSSMLQPNSLLSSNKNIRNSNSIVLFLVPNGVTVINYFYWTCRMWWTVILLPSNLLNSSWWSWSKYLFHTETIWNRVPLFDR